MPIGLLIPLLAPIATELVKWLIENTIAKIPTQFIPVISASLGAAASAIGPHVGVDLGVGIVEGAALGLGGTGVHQIQKLARTKP